MRYGVGPDGFLQRIHGYKVPAECLDGLVALPRQARSRLWESSPQASCGYTSVSCAVGLHEGCKPPAWAGDSDPIRRNEVARLAHRWEVENGTLFSSLAVQTPTGSATVPGRPRRRRSSINTGLAAREIRTAIVGQMDGRVKWFSYESILLTMDVLVRGTPLGLQETRIAPE